MEEITPYDAKYNLSEAEEKKDPAPVPGLLRVLKSKLKPGR